MTGKQQAEGIKTPHDHDVLSGRGNFVNYHPGNEHFRALVRKHKMEYVKCPKPQKGKFSKLIYEEIKARNPPGRFLKQDASTKLWYDIGEKKALDKTRQALREGAPELMKELSGDSGEEDSDEEVIARKKKPPMSSGMSNAAGGALFPGDPSGGMQNSFLGGFSSPVLSRNGMMSIGSIGMSPAGISPGLLSPGLMMTPEMQFSAQQQMHTASGVEGRLQSPLSQMIPPPQVHNPSGVAGMNMLSPQQQQQFLMQQQLQQQQQLTSQQQQQMMLNASAMAMGNNFDMLTTQQQHQQQQMRINQMRQQAMNNQLHQQQLQQQHLQSQQLQQQQMQPQQIHMNQMRSNQQQKPRLQQQQEQHQQKPQNVSEMQALQSKLAAIYNPESFDPTPIADQTIATKGRSDAASAAASAPKVEIPPGNNPRRMPPPSLLKRDDSLKMEKVFDSPGGTTKKKYGDGQGSSAHLSAMSLSMGDLNDESNLSQVFDTSLKISTGASQKQNMNTSNNNNNNNNNSKQKAAGRTSLSPVRSSKPSSAANWNQSKASDKSSWNNTNFDMSVATIGAASEIGASEVGNMSYATFNMPEQEEQMSFSHVFEDQEK